MQEFTILQKKKPFDRLPNEGLRELPFIPYYEENRVTIHKDGSVYFRGRVFYVDKPLWQDAEGK